jgi:hypothetical protein
MGTGAFGGGAELMATPAKILVCTPTLHRFAGTHRVDNLERNIRAVQGQTYPQIEHVIVKAQCAKGAGCEECARTAALAAKYGYGNAGQRRYISLDVPGDRFGYYGRNLAIQTSDAPLIAYLDDDNWWEPGHLQSVVDALEHAQAAFAFSASYVRSAEGRLLLKRITRKPYFCGIDLNELLHRRSLIEKYGPWDLSYNADWDAVATWMRAGERYAATTELTANYTLKPGWKAICWYFYSYTKHRIANPFS